MKQSFILSSVVVVILYICGVCANSTGNCIRFISKLWFSWGTKWSFWCRGSFKWRCRWYAFVSGMSFRTNSLARANQKVRPYDDEKKKHLHFKTRCIPAQVKLVQYWEQCVFQMMGHGKHASMRWNKIAILKATTFDPFRLIILLTWGQKFLFTKFYVPCTKWMRN